MFVVGATINSSVPGIPEILDQKDEEKLLKLAEHQINLGAQMLAVNAGDRIKTELDDIEWVTRTIQSRFEIPVCFDSPNYEVFEMGLSIHNNDFGRPLVNSITGEKERMEKILPLVAEHKVPVVGLLMDEEGISTDPEKRLKVADKIMETTRAFSIPDHDVYLDPMVFPVSVDHNNGCIYMETLKLVKERYPEARTVCGLNNISHGLPKRDLINSVFISMIAALGQDAIFVEMTEVVSSTIKAVNLLCGQDDFSSEYIRGYREGKYDIFKQGADRAVF